MPVVDQILPSIVVNGVEYTFNHCPPNIQHAIRLLVQKWDRDFDDRTLVQPWAAHRARLLAQKWGRPHP